MQSSFSRNKQTRLSDILVKEVEMMAEEVKEVAKVKEVAEVLLGKRRWAMALSRGKAYSHCPRRRRWTWRRFWWWRLSFIWQSLDRKLKR